MLLRPFRWLGRNLSTLLIALFLAAIVWISAVLAADPNQVCDTPKSLPIEIEGEDPERFRIGELPSQASIEIFAPSSVCTQIRNAIDELRAVVNLNSLEAGDHEVEVQLYLPERFRPLRINSFTPKSVQVNLEAIIERRFPVALDLSGEPALGFQADEVILTPTQVTVSGPKSVVDTVDRVQAALSISGVRQTVQTSLNLRALSEDSALVTGITLSPSRVNIQVPVRQLGGYRDVAVQVKTEGQWATGYRLTSISVTPPTVTVFSEDPQLVNRLPGFIETVPIDLTDENDNLVRSVALNLPEDITLVGIETVLVQVNIAAIESNLTINLPIELIGQSPIYGYELSPEVVDVILFGPLPVLDELTPSDVRVVVDVTDLEEGTYQITPLVDFLPEPLQEQGINPSTVEITVTLLPTPTPTSTPAETPTVTP